MPGTTSKMKPAAIISPRRITVTSTVHHLRKPSNMVLTNFSNMVLNGTSKPRDSFRQKKQKPTEMIQHKPSQMIKKGNGIPIPYSRYFRHTMVKSHANHRSPPKTS